MPLPVFRPQLVTSVAEVSTADAPPPAEECGEAQIPLPLVGVKQLQHLT
jgi:hypothetical protein